MEPIINKEYIMGHKSLTIKTLTLFLIAGFTTAFIQPETSQMNDGDEWLNKLAGAVIEEGTTVETITTELEQVIMSPMGEVTISGTSSINFVTGDQQAKLETPQGVVEVSIEDGKGVQKVGGQEMPLNDAQLAQIETETERNYLYVAIHKDSLEAEYLGTEEIEGTEYAKLEIDLTVPVTYYLDMETSLPAKITYKNFNQQSGQEVDVEVRYSDWRTVSGVTYAFSTESYVNGQKTSTGTINEIMVNE